MYLSALKIKNFRQFGSTEPGFLIQFNQGVTALVGENDSGKTAVIDAIRYVLQTRDSEFMRLQPEDFYISAEGDQATEIVIACKFSGLSEADKGAFAEYLTYKKGEVFLYVYWSARRLNDSPTARRWVDITVRTGRSGEGPTLDTGARQLLATAYLRPLRDAEREMSPGRGSRLSQVLSNFPNIKVGVPFDSELPPGTCEQAEALNLAGMAEYLRHLVNLHPGIGNAQDAINKDYLEPLSLAGEALHGSISFAEGGTEAARLRQILERLELGLLEEATGQSRGTYGLGSNNVLFMACELLLLGKEPDGLPLLLIEEPEAHLHPQRQLRLMEFLEAAAIPEPETNRRPVQVILTTHSPNLSSKIPLTNLVLMHRQRAYSLAETHTELSSDDYRFLDRFLDVSKANLFFARGLIIVEGDGEAILIPALARLIGKDLTKHGVSIINVGGTGLRRYARILQRKEPGKGELQIPSACLADMDVMPDCAPEILGLVDDDDDKVWKSSKRRWKAKRDFGGTQADQSARLLERRNSLMAGDAQCVKTFVANEWTLEYDLAYAGLAKQVYVAATLAASEKAMDKGKRTRDTVINDAVNAYSQIESDSQSNEHLCSQIYEIFSNRASKAIAAQHLIDVLIDEIRGGDLNSALLRQSLPSYIIGAIDYATTPIEDLPDDFGDLV